jgi:putative peptide zinc metalloprotease protein
MVVRAVVSQDDADLVRTRTEDVQVRMAERIGDVYAATLRRLVPAASDRLPSIALGASGGGEVAIDPRDPEGSRSVESMFEVELEVAADTPVVNPGGRVYIRFDLGNEALVSQWYRRLRQIFLARFHV